MYHLVIDHAVGKRYACQEGEQVGGDGVAVDVRPRVGFYHGRKADLVNVNQREGTDDTVACFQVFV
nr:hypothetical protein [Parabacteroides goldsteinii]